MKGALHIVAVQHELSMAVGSTLDLSAMLRHFLRTCNSLLNLTSSHVFLFHDEANHPIESQTDQPVFKHYLSLPKQYKSQEWKTSETLKTMAEAILNEHNFYREHLLNSHRFYSIAIPSHGVIVLESHSPIPEIILRSLRPIIQKLATSCYSCIAHEALKKEISARQLAEDIVTHQAHHDELTQLQNRRKLTDELSKAQEKARQSGTYGSLIFIDLNQFKSVNDVMGHEVGDQLLKLIGMRLANLKQKHETIARFGGDEFVVLLPDLANTKEKAEERTIAFIHKLNKKFGEPIVISKTNYTIDCSIGYDIFPEDGVTDLDVIKNADMAMYEAKDCKELNYLRYTSQMAINLNKKLSYIEKLKASIKKKEFTLYYQPQINHKNEIVGAEALLRWNHPDHIHDSPAIYVPIAEETDLINQIGESIIETACLHTRQLEDQGLPQTFERLSINVSAKQMAYDNLVNYFKEIMFKTKVSPHLLGIELTENVLIQNVENVIAILSEFNHMGVKCSIDDFGTGYSSLSYLRKLPLYAIKIDRSFVTNIHNDSEIRSIAQMIISLGENLAMNVLAEGIETKEELDCIQKLGCKTYQGYYFYRPMPFNQFKELIKQYK